MNEKREFFIGIDLGIKEKKTTGVSILDAAGKCILCQDVFGKNVLRKISPYLKETKVIGIDAPLTAGKGKGLFRLYEKFLSTKIFRQEKVNPVPPILMPGFCNFSQELVEKLESRGFTIDLNLIEVFPALVRKISKKEFFMADCKAAGENQESALICAVLALLHSQFKTRYLGYRDGFLFFPKISFWKKDWRQKFYQAWEGRERLKYHHLKTNIFDK